MVAGPGISLFAYRRIIVLNKPFTESYTYRSCHSFSALYFICEQPYNKLMFHIRKSRFPVV